MFGRKPRSADPSGSLAERLSAAPRPATPKLAKKAVADLIIASETPALERLCAQKPVRRLLEAIADGSPFLWDLIRKSPSSLVEALEANPESHLASLIAHRSKAARAAIDDGAAARELRLLKQQGALLIALA